MGGNIDNTSPWISPISRHVDCFSFEGFPKTFIAAGGLEELKDQVVVSKETLERDIGEGNVEYYLAPFDFIMLRIREDKRIQKSLLDGHFMIQLPILLSTMLR